MSLCSFCYSTFINDLTEYITKPAMLGDVFLKHVSLNINHCITECKAPLLLQLGVYLDFYLFAMHIHIACIKKTIIIHTRFANVWSQMKQTWLIFTHLKLWVAVARHNLKWVNFCFNVAL